jgi:hypothetical protein
VFTLKEVGKMGALVKISVSKAFSQKNFKDFLRTTNVP